MGPDDPVFATRNGTRNTPDNVRRRILAGVHEGANVMLDGHDVARIGHLTPHTLRRTFASLLAELGVSPRRAMYLLGHADPKVTMRVYQQVLDMGGSSVGAVEAVLGCTVDEAFATLRAGSSRTQ
jgi:integrase